MTTLRKWRFPILIGSGIIAAGALIYFSNGHVSTEKTQGAIGQRDVYRDGQVSSADVATPGSAPVANEAILETSEFKALAKNPAFQEIMRSDVFNENSHRKAMADLFGNENFRQAVRDKNFAELVNDVRFQAAVRSQQGLSVALSTDLRYRAMDTRAMQELMRLDSFKVMALNKTFDRLLASSAMREMMAQPAFALLASQAAFNQALASGAMTQATERLRIADLRAGTRSE
jgi:hypothetical protein